MTPTLKRFIVLEGVDGAGTTTQLRRLDEALARRGIAHLVTCEPTPLPTGRLVRQVLKGEVDARPETLARLFSADRHEHLYGPGGVLECLGRGDVVVSDRYLFSSLVYQGIDCGPELPRLLNAAFPLPELLIYFDLPVEVSMARVERRAERDIFEHRTFQEKARAAYEAVLAEYADSPMRIVRLDASLPLEEVWARVAVAVGDLVGAGIVE
ncbi:MAG: dTMP kinase [Spirochaetaceae bacterium]|nr:dTMP kinase [Spirochaetaceae bacterium]